MAALVNSGSGCQTKPETLLSQKIGCTSGLFHLLHSPTRKRLTSASARKQQESKSECVPPRKPKTSKTSARRKPPAKHYSGGARTIRLPANVADPPSDFHRFSYDVPRSPTLPPEIRRSNSISSPESSYFRRSPIALLMGLEEAVPPVTPPKKDTASEKRRKLLGALEKCDEDLKAMKKIIEAIKNAEITTTNWNKAGVDATTTTRMGQHPAREKAENQWQEANSGEQPSPVSVLDGTSVFSSPSMNGQLLTPDRGRERQNKKTKDNSFFERIVAEAPSLLSSLRQREEIWVARMMSTVGCRARLSGSKAMVETINEVWMDGIWGQGWELGRVSVVLESDIFGELVSDLIKDLVLCCNCSSKRVNNLPLEACRKRLNF